MKALISLDWLDAEIDKLHEKGAMAGISSIDDIRFDTLIEVRSKCEPIEEPKTLSVIGKVNKKYSGLLYGEPKELPSKCELDWESAKYCHNNDKCLMCNTK